MTSTATDREIASQPGIWESWSQELPGIAQDVRGWIATIAPDEIWLCGAGTSAFIGDSLAVALGRTGHRVRAIPTTDLVARPQDYVRDGLRPLVVSFGRSGNSSESIGTLDILDRLAPGAARLNITCNATSALATREPANGGAQRVITLPDACHDSGFAMTSSYTTMLLTALACLDDDCPTGDLAARGAQLAAAARTLLALPLAPARPERVVFLGAGPFLGSARESALKVLELTAGRVTTSWDSTLGFRHGPKAVIDDRTAVYILLSADPLTRKYDQDIATEIRAQFPAVSVTTMGRAMPDTDAPDIPFGTGLDDVWNTPIAVLVAQRLAVAWSKSLDLNVDDPFFGRNLTRVVANVRLYS
ncbi:SIS domain-containing protein [Paracoccus sp. (in: a-proteobacteria)]|uniref:SIS domain-containing protein n=1 Tax=Paracoccus sp. TaxID=267 RepID=UPI003A8B74BF